jgi:hypothetical protein
MIEQISAPVAHAVVTWVPAADSGRRSGPPDARVYAATCVFVMGGDREVLPDWPAGAEHLSILLEEVETLAGGARLCKVDFLARDLARPYIHPGQPLLIMEGPRVVANAVIRDVAEEDGAQDR